MCVCDPKHYSPYCANCVEHDVERKCGMCVNFVGNVESGAGDCKLRMKFSVVDSKVNTLDECGAFEEK